MKQQFLELREKVGKVTLGKTENKFVTHIMSGISYMTPMVIAAGILLAIANIFAFQEMLTWSNSKLGI